jgi:hypothetical protein
VKGLRKSKRQYNWALQGVKLLPPPEKTKKRNGGTGQRKRVGVKVGEKGKLGVYEESRGFPEEESREMDRTTR